MTRDTFRDRKDEEWDLGLGKASTRRSSVNTQASSVTCVVESNKRPEDPDDDSSSRLSNLLPSLSIPQWSGSLQYVSRIGTSMLLNHTPGRLVVASTTSVLRKRRD